MIFQSPMLEGYGYYMLRAVLLLQV